MSFKSFFAGKKGLKEGQNSPKVKAHICGLIAQLGERNAGSVEVCGSIPHGSTIKLDSKIQKINSKIPS